MIVSANDGLTSYAQKMAPRGGGIPGGRGGGTLQRAMLSLL